MPGGFYTYRDKTRRHVRAMNAEDSAALDEINRLAERLLELRKSADSGDVASMKDANEVIGKITEKRIDLDKGGHRTRYDSDKKKFVFD